MVSISKNQNQTSSNIGGFVGIFKIEEFDVTAPMGQVSLFDEEELSGFKPDFGDTAVDAPETTVEADTVKCEQIIVTSAGKPVESIMNASTDSSNDIVFEANPYELFPNIYHPVDAPAPPILQQALRLGHLGYKIFPVRGMGTNYSEKDLKALAKKGPYPLAKAPIIIGGCKSASNDVEFIAKNFTDPAIGIGIACLDYIIGIDIDVDEEEGKDGFADLQYLENEHGIYLPAPLVTTPRGGGHIILKAPADWKEINGRAGIIIDGRETAIDIRVGNEYLIAPGTVVPSPFNPNERAEYTGNLPPVADLPELPEELHRLLPRKGSQVSMAGTDVDFNDLEALSAEKEAEKEQKPQNSFPIEVLADICPELRNLALGFQRETHFPAAYVALPGIVAFSSLLGNCNFLNIGVNRDEPGTLWGCCFGEPSSGKTPGWKLATTPYLNIHTRINKGELELTATCPPAKIKKPGRPKEGEPQYEEVPVKPNYLLTRFTTSALIENLIKNARGPLVSNDEMGAIWKRINNGGSDDGSFDTFNAFWTGSPQVDATKTSASFDGKTEHSIDKAYFAMIGTTQPENLRTMKALSVMWSSGHLVRYLVAYPPKPKLPEDFQPVPLSVGVFEDYCVMVNDAFRLLYQNASPDTPTNYTLQDDAKTRFKEYELDVRRRGETENNNKKRQYLSKLPTHVARLTLALHLMKWASRQGKGVPDLRSEEIDKETLEAAIKIGEWSYNEFCRLTDYLDGKKVKASALSDTGFILQLLETNGGSMTRRALSQISRFRKNPKTLPQALSELVALNAIRVESTKSANHKIFQTYYLI